jgi:hypothetical protein
VIGNGSAPGARAVVAWRRFLAVLLGLLALGVAFSAPAGARMIAAYPSPGTQLASPSSDVSFDGITRAALGPVRIRGSRTGIHRGRFRAFGNVKGVAFIPARPFAARERVTVTSPRHTFFGTGRHSYSFRTGMFLRQNLGKEPWSPNRGQKPKAWDSFKTLRLKIPRVTVEADRPGRSEGSIFYAPRTSGPTILDADGNLVYYRPGLRVTDFRAQRYRGRTVLTWWRRAKFGNRVDSRFEMADRHYRVFKRWRGGNGYTGDPHEFNLTSRGTALITAYRTAVVDMSRIGGPKRGFVLDYIGQEIDLATGLVVWEWHPLGKLRLNDSYLPIPRRNTRPFDWFHMNSVNLDRDGNMLISSRHTQALYKVNRRTGRIIWRIGGKRSDFRLGKGVRFGFQHDLHRHADGTLTIFDNGAGGVHGKVNRFSSAKVLRVNEKRRVVRLVHAYRDPRTPLSESQGNAQVLGNGNIFVGWGSRNACTEFAPDGRVLFDFTFAAKSVSYRCFKSAWTGAPTTPIAVRSAGRGTGSRIWMSWNGDTRVSHWRILAGPAPGGLATVATIPRQGFESVADLDQRYPFYRVIGLSPAGKVLGRSKVNPLGKLTR